MPEPGRMAARINWRISKPDGDFIERSVVQVGVTAHTAQQAALPWLSGLQEG